MTGSRSNGKFKGRDSLIIHLLRRSEDEKQLQKEQHLLIQLRMTCS